MTIEKLGTILRERLRALEAQPAKYEHTRRTIDARVKLLKWVLEKMKD